MLPQDKEEAAVFQFDQEDKTSGMKLSSKSSFEEKSLS